MLSSRVGPSSGPAMAERPAVCEPGAEALFSLLLTTLCGGDCTEEEATVVKEPAKARPEEMPELAGLLPLLSPWQGQSPEEAAPEQAARPAAFVPREGGAAFLQTARPPIQAERADENSYRLAQTEESGSRFFQADEEALPLRTQALLAPILPQKEQAQQPPVAEPSAVETTAAPAAIIKEAFPDEPPGKPPAELPEVKAPPEKVLPEEAVWAAGAPLAGRPAGNVGQSERLGNGSASTLAVQVADAVRENLNSQKDRFTLRLKPDGLGEVTVSLSLRNNVLEMHIQSGVGAAGRLIGSELDRLRAELEASGYQVGRLTAGNPAQGMTEAAEGFFQGQTPTAQGQSFAGDQSFAKEQEPAKAGQAHAQEAKSEQTMPQTARLTRLGGIHYRI